MSSTTPIQTSTSDTSLPHLALSLMLSTCSTSTTKQTPGQCKPDESPASGSCSWRVTKVLKRVDKKCADRTMNQHVQAYIPECFQECGADSHNTSSLCWIRCFYKAVLGPQAATLPNATGGMSISALEEAWRKPFLSDDASKGGCPDIDRVRS